MAFRRHLIAVLGGDEETVARELDLSVASLGRWRLSFSSPWSLGAEEVDWRIAKTTRTSLGLGLRATTVDDAFVDVAVFYGGRRMAVFDHAFGGVSAEELADELGFYGEDEEELDLAPDEPVPPEVVRNFEGGDDEVLARLRSGSTPRGAVDATLAGRAERLAAIFEEAGALPDRARLLTVLRGELSRGGPWADSPWMDLPELLEALGVAGLGSWLDEVAESEVEAGDPGTADETEREEAADESAEDPRQSVRRRMGKLGCFALVAVMVLGAGLGGWWGSAQGSSLSAVGGAVLGLLAVPTLVALLLGVRLFRWGRRLKRAVGGDGELASRQALTGDLRPEHIPAARLLLADLGDLAHRLRRERTATPLFGLYAGRFLPKGAEGLAEQWRGGEDPRPLARRVGRLRLRLIDVEREGGDLEPLRQELDRLLSDLRSPSA